MKTLAQYLNDTGISRAELARSIGVSRSFLTELAQGKKRPGWGNVARIEAATGGAVTAMSWSVPCEMQSFNAADGADADSVRQPIQKAVNKRGPRA